MDEERCQKQLKHHYVHTVHKISTESKEKIVFGPCHNEGSNNLKKYNITFINSTIRWKEKN